MAGGTSEVKLHLEVHFVVKFSHSLEVHSKSFKRVPILYMTVQHFKNKADSVGFH